MPPLAQNRPHERCAEPAARETRARSDGIAIAPLIVGGLPALGGITNLARAIQYELSATKSVIADTASGLGRVELAPETAVALEERRAKATDEASCASTPATAVSCEVAGTSFAVVAVDNLS
jgi:hypothetical protein